MDILLPATDAGVLLQAVVWTALLALGIIVTRRNRDVRLLVVGIGILGYGLMAVRAIH